MTIQFLWIFIDFSWIMRYNWYNYSVLWVIIIHTDEKVEKQLIEAAIKKYRMRFVIIPTIILIAMTLIFAIFSQEYLLYLLSSTYSLLLPILVIIVNLFPIIISNKMYKIDKEKVQNLLTYVYFLCIIKGEL